jgi:hypothetical protein
MKLSSNNSAERANAGVRMLPRPRTKREYQALYGGLDQYGPDEVRDRLRDQLGCRPTKAALGALAQATRSRRELCWNLLTRLRAT